MIFHFDNEECVHVSFHCLAANVYEQDLDSLIILYPERYSSRCAASVGTTNYTNNSDHWIRSRIAT